jgi:type I restriction enzyme M protein
LSRHRLWAAADELRANSKLKASKYSTPVLGLIFLRFAEHRFEHAQGELEGASTGRRKISKLDYQQQGVLYVPEKARFSYLRALPDNEDIAKRIREAMDLVEAENDSLKGVLPKNYQSLEKSILVSLLKTFSEISMDIEGDAFGRIYEYFLGKFALSEGQKGGEFFTPTSIVKLIVAVIEPYQGRMYFLSEALASETTGWVEVDEDIWQIWFGPVEVALYDAVDRTLWPLGSAVSGPRGGR